MAFFANQPKVSGASPGFVFRSRKGDERRAFVRYSVDCQASLVFMTGAVPLHGKLTDLSLGGCRVATDLDFQPGTQVRAELQFTLLGTPFRVIGITVGSRSRCSFALRFLNVPSRRREELASLLAEHEAELQSHRERDAPREIPIKLTASLVPPLGAIDNRTEQLSGQGRRIQRRIKVDTFATLKLIHARICMRGRIEDLSLTGCRLRTEERFNLGILVRIEVEFCLHGLPFRLAGVSQVIWDQNTIGIRFLDVCERKRQQLNDLMAEIIQTEVEPSTEVPATESEKSLSERS